MGSQLQVQMDSREKSQDKKEEENLVEEKPKVRPAWIVITLALIKNIESNGEISQQLDILNSNDHHYSLLVVWI